MNSMFKSIPLLVLLSINTAHAQNVTRNLVVCGGGTLPATVFNKFRKMAGDAPKLVLIPTASQREYKLSEAKKLWAKRGFEQVNIFRPANPKESISDKEMELLKSASAVWIGGGSQQRLADSFLGTQVETELIRLADHGVVIGGTSAGAAFQTKIMKI